MAGCCEENRKGNDGLGTSRSLLPTTAQDDGSNPAKKRRSQPKDLKAELQGAFNGHELSPMITYR